ACIILCSWECLFAVWSAPAWNCVHGSVCLPSGPRLHGPASIGVFVCRPDRVCMDLRPWKCLFAVRIAPAWTCAHGSVYLPFVSRLHVFSFIVFFFFFLFCFSFFFFF